MEMIRPMSDLRNNFAEISKTVHETKKPVFLTKNGFGDMVVLYCKLQEAEREAQLTDKRFSAKDVLKAMKDAARE